MKIEYRKGDLLKTDIRHILHGCNTQGVMGAGVAKLIRTKYPAAYTDYIIAYYSYGLFLGEVIYSLQDDDKVILNAITQKTIGHRGTHVSYWAIAKVFHTLNQILLSGEKVAMPMIGAGLGGGDWTVIAAIIENCAETYQPVVYQL